TCTLRHRRPRLRPVHHAERHGRLPGAVRRDEGGRHPRRTGQGAGRVTLGLNATAGDGPDSGSGELPAGWARATLEELAVEVQPGFASGKHNRDGDGIVHLRPMNITRSGAIDLSDARYVRDDSDRRVEYGDVVFNNTNSPAL